MSLFTARRQPPRRASVRKGELSTLRATAKAAPDSQRESQGPFKIQLCDFERLTSRIEYNTNRWILLTSPVALGEDKRAAADRGADFLRDFFIKKKVA